jgi:hypothetical protein
MKKIDNKYVGEDIKTAKMHKQKVNEKLCVKIRVLIREER